MTTYDVKFVRVLGHRSHAPAVVAIVDGQLVKWNRNAGWITECMCPLDGPCAHIDAVLDLLDLRVLGEIA